MNGVLNPERLVEIRLIKREEDGSVHSSLVEGVLVLRKLELFEPFLDRLDRPLRDVAADSAVREAPPEH